MPKILVIDDDAGVRRLIERSLSKAGHVVVLAEDGEQGLTRFREHKPDLVITDIIMPEREGIETILALRRIDPALPILAISGGGGYRDQLLDTTLKLGASATLGKPFRTADLLQAVDTLIAERRAGGTGGG